MDALDQFRLKAFKSPDVSDPTYMLNTENTCLHWGELIFELNPYADLINVYLHDFEPIGVYGYEQAYEVMEGHQRMFKDV